MNGHHHVLMFTQKTGIRIYTAGEYTDLQRVYKKTIQLVQDITGEKIASHTLTSTTFDNNSYVKWSVCFKGCLDGLTDAQIQENVGSSQPLHGL